MTGPAKEPAGGKDRPLYEIVRDELISEIKSGAYPAGALLPSVRELTVQRTISTTTARKALAEVVAAGHAKSEGTRGHISTGPTPTTTATPQPAEAGPRAPAGLTVRAQHVVDIGGAIDPATCAVDLRAEPGPAEVMQALRLTDSRTPIVVRRSLATDTHGTPTQLTTSYTIREIADGTPLANADAIDLPWFRALAEYSGKGVTLASRDISARHPSDSEAAVLALALTACVLVRVDVTHDEHGQPIDYTVTVWPGDSTRIAAGPAEVGAP